MPKERDSKPSDDSNRRATGKGHPQKWNDTCNRFVAFMDILGFRDLVRRKTHQHVLNLMMSFLPSTIEPLKIEAHEKLSGNQASPPGAWELYPNSVVKPVLFSDSILLVSGDASLDSLGLLLFWSKWIVAQALQQGIPIKGAIAYGEETASFGKDLHFGRPLIDAYELQNELILYGVVLHHTAEQYLTDAAMIQKVENYNVFKWAATPLEAGKITHYVVDWTDVFEISEGKADELQPTLSRLYGNVSGPARRYVDNTAEFTRWITARKAELEKERKVAREWAAWKGRPHPTRTQQSKD